MSDAARKGLGEQAQEKLTPDSSKSTTDKISENVSGTADRVAGSVQPQDSKSTTQKVGDSVRGGSDDASNQGKSYMDSASDTVNSGLQGAKDTLGLNK